MNDFDTAALMSRSSVFDPAVVDWTAVPRQPLPAAARRALCYMQDVESHTVVYLRELLATRAVNDPEIAAFLATWFYEETAHGRVLGQFLAAAGHPGGGPAPPRRAASASASRRSASAASPPPGASSRSCT